ncbi:MAG: hypothetical protein WCO40_01340 [Thermoleophilia bacterium]
MTKRFLLIVGALAVLLALPTLAGAAIAFTKLVKNQPANSTIYVYTHDEGHPATTVALNVKGGQPTISPDGKIVAYYVNNNGGVLHFVTIATNAVVATTNFCGPQPPVWAPDSSAVACTLPAIEGSPSIASVTTTGVTTPLAKWLPGVGLGLGAPTWSPDSSMIAWVSGAGGKLRLRAMKADGTGSLIKLGSFSQSQNLDNPLWGPKRIAYTLMSGSGTNSSTNIWTIKPGTNNNSTATQLTRYKGMIGSGPSPLMWTPNGKIILGEIDMEDQAPTPVSINAATGKITKLGPSGNELTGGSPIAASSDSSSALVLFASNVMMGIKPTGTVRTVSLSTGKSTLFMNNVSYMSASADWRP